MPAAEKAAAEKAVPSAKNQKEWRPAGPAVYAPYAPGASHTRSTA